MKRGRDRHDDSYIDDNRDQKKRKKNKKYNARSRLVSLEGLDDETKLDTIYDTCQWRQSIVANKKGKKDNHDQNEEKYYDSLKGTNNISILLNREIPTQDYCLPEGYTIEVLSSSLEIDEWITKHVRSCVGCDSEWDFVKYDMNNPAKRVPNDKPDIITIATLTSCLIFPTRFQPPFSLLTLLSDPSIKKIWIGDDSKKMKKWLLTLEDKQVVQDCIKGFNNKKQGSHIDLNTLLPKNFAGARQICSRILGYKIQKDFSLTLSRWSRIQLSNEQKEYAAMDALLNLQVYEKWLTHHPQ
jgi:hypothetical protein